MYYHYAEIIENLIKLQESNTTRRKEKLEQAKFKPEESTLTNTKNNENPLVYIPKKHVKLINDTISPTRLSDNVKLNKKSLHANHLSLSSRNCKSFILNKINFHFVCLILFYRCNNITNSRKRTKNSIKWKS